MSNQWFRLYGDFVNNPKVQIVTEALRYRYVALLCLHCNGDYENRPDDEIALSLRVTVEEWISTRTEFVKRELLTPDYKIKGWEKKQYISDIKDPTAADRQKRYREKKRDKRNVPVTSRLPDSDTDTDKNIHITGSDFQKIFEAGIEIFPALVSRSTAVIHQWLADGVNPELDAIPEIRRQKGRDIGSWTFFTQSIINAKATRLSPAPKGNAHANTGRNAPQTKTDRLRAAALRAAESGGFAPRPPSQATANNDALSVFPSPEIVR